MTAPEIQRQQPESSGRTGWLIAVGLAVSVLLFHGATLRTGHVWGDDFAQYIQQAMNFAHGRPAGETGYIYNPQFPEIGPRAYPPLFPLFLAPVVRIGGINLTALKMVGVVFFSMALLAIFAIAAQILPLPYALCLVALVGINPYFWDYKDTISSDVPFLFFCFVALGLLWKCETGKWQHTGLAVLAGIAIYVTYIVRSAGGILLPVMVFACVVRLRRIPLAAWAAISAALVLIGLQTVFALRDASSYTDSFRSREMTWAGTIVSNLVSYTWLIRTHVWPLDGKYVTLVWFAFFSMLLLWGYSKRVRGEITVLEVFTAAYFTMILLLPWADLRYMIPLIPLCLLYVAEAARGLGKPHASRRAKAGVVTLLVLLAGSCLSGYTRVSFKPIPESFNNAGFMAASGFLREKTPKDAVVICRKPRLSVLTTGRRSSAYALKASDEELWQWIEQTRAQYLLAGPALPDDAEILLPFIRRNQDRLGLVFQHGDFAVYRVNRKRL